MPDESAPFIEMADAAGEASVVGQAEHRLLSFGPARVLLVQCGIGMVNASTSVAVAIAAHRPRVVISAGSAGGLAPDLHVGDVAVGTEYTYPGADARAFGYALGQIPRMPESYTGDEDLLASVVATAPDDLRVMTGLMLAGDSFIDAEAFPAIRDAFPLGISTDMESTAIAQTCFLFGIPFVSVRGISDLCGPSAGSDFKTHVDDAAERSARVVVAALAGRERD